MYISDIASEALDPKRSRVGARNVPSHSADQKKRILERHRCRDAGKISAYQVRWPERFRSRGESTIVAMDELIRALVRAALESSSAWPTVVASTCW